MNRPSASSEALESLPDVAGDSRDMAKGAAVNFLGILARGLTVALFLVLGRLYGSAATGIFLLARAYVDIISKLGILGLDRTVLIVGAKQGAKGDLAGLHRCIGQSLSLALIAATVTMGLLQFGAAQFAAAMGAAPTVVSALAIMATAIPVWAIAAVLLFATRALRKMHYEVLAKGVIEPLVMLLLAVAVFPLGLGMRGLALGFVVASVCSTFAALIFFARSFPVRPVLRAMLEWRGSWQLLRFAVPIGLYDMLTLVLQRIDLLIVGQFLPAASTGVYSIAREIGTTAKAIRLSFDPIAIPVLAAAQQRGDRPRLRQHYQNLTRWNLSLSAALLGGVFLGRHSIMSLFGPDFGAGADALALLMLANTINCGFGMPELILLVDRPVINLLNTLGTVGAMIGFGLLLTPLAGMEGAAFAAVLANVLLSAARLLQVWVIYRLQPFGRDLAKLGLAFTTTLLLALLAEEALGLGTTLLAETMVVAIFAALYLGSCAALGLIQSERLRFRAQESGAAKLPRAA